MRKFDIIVSSCYKRQHLLKPLLYSYDKYFVKPPQSLEELPRIFIISDDPFSNPYEKSMLYWNTHMNDVGDHYWGTMMLKALKGMPSKYLMFICDDYWLTKELNYDIINGLVDRMKKDNLCHIRLMKSTNEGIDCEYPDLQTFKDNATYICSFAPGLWNVEVLKTLLNPNENIWEAESKVSERARSNRKKFFAVREDVYPTDHFFTHGKYTEEAKEYCKKEGLNEADYLKEL